MFLPRESSHFLKKLPSALSSNSTLSFLSLRSPNKIHLGKSSLLFLLPRKESIIFTILEICAAERLFWSAQNLLFVPGNSAPSCGCEAPFLDPNSLKEMKHMKQNVHILEVICGPSPCL